MTQSQAQHFRAYYHDNALLIQFVLTDFIKTALLAEQLKLLSIEYLESKDRLEEALDPLLLALNHLVGTLSEQEALTLSRWTKGPLTKLKEHCEHLYRNSPSQNVVIETLHSYVCKAWLHALHNLELINAMRIGLKPANIKLTLVKQAFTQLHSALNSIAKLIPRVVEGYTENNYVLFYLYRSKDQLIRIYGASLVNKLLKISKNIDKKPDLLHSFREKGFDILSLINEGGIQ